MDPLSQHYSDGTRKWLQLHPGRVVTIKQMARLYGETFMKADSVETAVNGFRNTGISHWIQKFFPIVCFSHLKLQTCRLQKSLLTQQLWL
jgi:hypothetical protein